ncbi:DNA mismatch repair protein MutS [Evansella cellulosilytica]|uniref:DNA mismatch repair protein MutS n=1 Tax=Evansella cellulosilytica (strain ATCC 21833 / DSM 2522 / FERM P-1141 / JCM 9156 / N-4) TaxID=649639 RepID=E6TS19_EVAC2|nr:DNA mismatch repair protein MutS [Evansella cellulosilytica]ADU30673.1 DNA mismatch repair protein MutS [Evansella cellulosilytica DSM 2522]
MAKQVTPMIEQYLSIKAQYEDAFLFFRLGDFYELFFDDAKKAASELEITLTSRGKGEDAIPMCGVPHHSAEQYISQLINNGFKVAICEQTEDPQLAKGVVRREVVQVITPGTVMEGNAVVEKDNNYLLSLTPYSEKELGLAAIDMTTGEFLTTVLAGDFEEAIHEVSSFRPKEIVIPSTLSDDKQNMLQQRMNVTLSFEDELAHHSDTDKLISKIEDQIAEIACRQLIQYVLRTTKRSLEHLQQANYYETNDFMGIDVHSKRNLELIESLREKKKKGSLLWVLDETETAMGGRLLKQWIERPLVSNTLIEKRQSLVETLLERFFERETLKVQLNNVYDLERLSGKIAFGNVNARDMLQLKRSLQAVPQIFDTVNDLGNNYATELTSGVNDCHELYLLLENSINEDPPVTITDGNIIKDGYDRELDQYRDAMRNGKTWIAALERKERDETGIKSLKIGFNKVFGYYIEVTKANIPNLPEGRYERKQTLANAERYITNELKEKEALILEAEEKSEKLEYELFMEIREKVKQFIRPLQKLATSVSTIDVLQSFAEVAEKNHYVKPDVSNEETVDIIDGRHPVVEQMIDKGDYVANDIRLNEERGMLLITGPNMAGKSTYMRQLALIAIMAQIGSFVPAKNAKLPIFDQIFTRIGAADDLAQGQSTFMVEMMETRHAVSRATKNSLILLDEIGRGTSTYDGMALAQAIMEYIHNEIGAKTLFSTHYHELTTLSEHLSHLRNVHVSAMEEDGKVVFLHKVIDGAADRSYGIYVAELAELPASLISRAKSILNEFEQGDKKHAYISNEEKRKTEPVKQLNLFGEAEENYIKNNKQQTITSHEKEIIATLQTINLLRTTPIEAIQVLDELQRKLQNGGS